MNILVTGASGFIGGAVTKKLLGQSSKVTILIRGKTKSLIPSGAKFKTGDLRDYKSLEKGFKNIDIVINCAGALPYHKLQDNDYWDINTKGTQNIVEACLKNKVKRLIHISTVGIYEKYKDVYAKSKLEGEKIIKNSAFKKNSVIIRPTICYGPGDVRPVFLKLFKMIKIGINISIGGGKNYFHTIYIDNLVDVIIKSIDKKSVSGQDFIVGDINCPKMKDITNEIIRVVNKPHLNINVPKKLALLAGKIISLERTVRFVSEDRKYSIDKTIKNFGLKSDIGISFGIERTFNWYKEKKLI